MKFVGMCLVEVWAKLAGKAGKAGLELKMSQYFPLILSQTWRDNMKLIMFADKAASQ